MADEKMRDSDKEQMDNKVRTPGEQTGEVETREPEQGEGQTVVYPEPTGTDNGQPTTLQQESPQGS